MSDPDPDLFPQAWDFALIAGISTTGVCTITQGGRVLKWDKKPGFGSAGATTKLTGIDPGEFQMRLEFFDGFQGITAAEARTFWEETMLPVLKKAEDGKQAIEFYHPAVSGAPMFCTQVVPQKVGIYEQDGNGTWSVTVSFLQYGKPKPAVGAPKGAAKKSPPQPQVLDENEKRIQDLTKQLKTLADE
jgi:hypothetical protein